MRTDFVKVKLSAMGAELAGEGTVRVIHGWLDEEFKASEVKSTITKLDWEKVLAKENRDGVPMFEVVEEQPLPKPGTREYEASLKDATFGG
jgi:hypothetical protein